MINYFGEHLRTAASDCTFSENHFGFVTKSQEILLEIF